MHRPGIVPLRLLLDRESGGLTGCMGEDIFLSRFCSMTKYFFLNTTENQKVVNNFTYHRKDVTSDRN